MKHTYSIVGMTCSGCEATVKNSLSAVAGVSNVNTDLSKNEITVEMREHVPTSTLQQALKNYPKYQLEEIAPSLDSPTNDVGKATWLVTYKPILLIFAYITTVTLLIKVHTGSGWMHWMSNFMGGFFLTFSFFKLLDLGGFAQNYFSYDVVSKRWFGYGYVYPFIELALGLAYTISFQPVLTNSVTLVIMGISMVGVVKAVFSKRKIKCACLGAVFNLPMSTVTIIEDSLMIVMSLFSLLSLMS